MYRSGKIPEKKGWTALHFAIASPDDKKRETRLSRQQALHTVRALLDAPNIAPTIKTHGQELLALATALPHVRRELISHPNFPSSERLPAGATPLNFLIEVKDRPAVERMLRVTDLDVELLSADGTYALSLLMKNDMADLALRLFEEGRVHPWNVDGAKDIGLSAAIFAAHEPLVTAYLEQLPEVPDPSHRLRLAFGASAAMMVGKSDVFLQRLIALGADPELRLTNSGWTLFHYAALVGNIEAFDQLALRSAATSRRDAWGRRPADLAPDHVRAQFDARMKDMADEPFAPEQADSLEPEQPPDAESHKVGASGKLFALARSGDIEGITELLADPDVDPTIRDNWGRSPADHAPDASREKIAALLRRAASDRHN